MGLQASINRLTGTTPVVRKSTRKWSKCVKSPRVYHSDKEDTTVLVDKNGQICGGSYPHYHGRPVKFDGKSLWCPDTVQVLDETGKMISVFDHYIPLIWEVEVFA